MATLSEYLKQTSITQRQLAQAAGISRSYLNEIAKRLKTPRLEVALRIQKATGGEVDLSTLIHSPSSEPQTIDSLPSKKVGDAAADIQGDAA